MVVRTWYGLAGVTLLGFAALEAQDAELAGKYVLAQANAAALPATYADAKGTSRTLVDGSIELYTNGSWLSKLHVRDERGRTNLKMDVGAYARDGDNVTFTSSEGGPSSGTLRGETIDLAYDVDGDQTPERLVFAKPGAALLAATQVTGAPSPTPTPQASDDPKVTAAAPSSPRAASTETVKWASVSAGAFSSCALATLGRAYCWGLRPRAAGSPPPGGNRPTAVGGGLTFTAISVGNAIACSHDRADESCASNDTYHACGLTTSGDAYCWGSNGFGQLGDSSISDRAAPVKVTGGLSFALISAGDAFVCGVTMAGVLYCWGRDAAGELGMGKVDGGSHPAPQAVAEGVKAVSASGAYACALRDDGSAFCWGSGSMSRLGTPQAVDYGPNPSPLQVETDQRFVAISAGRTHTCALTATGATYCWGGNSYLESGPGADRLHATRTPTSVPGPALATVAAGTAYHSCGVTRSGAAYCWGNNNKGQLGTGGSSPETCGVETWGCSSLPIAVTGGVAFKTISAGVEFTCGVTTTSDLLCWGDNSRGQLGTGDRESRATPTKVAGP